MKALAIVVALAGVAHAEPPKGWTATPMPPDTQFPHFGGMTYTTDGTRYTPAAGGVTFVITRITAPPPANVPAALRSELDSFEGAAQRASLAGSAADVQARTEQVDATHELVTATLAYTASGVRTSSRLVIARSATELVAVTGDCISRDGAGAALVAACTHALDTLDPGVAAAERVTPVLGTEPAPPPPSRPPPTTMSATDHAPLPPMPVPPPAPAKRDRTTMFAGAGIVVLAALFWWNSRRRAQLANEEDQDDR